MDELDALSPIPEQVKLESGTVVVFEDLRARQFFKLLRIITHGALPLIQDSTYLRMDPDAEPTEFIQRLLSVLLLSIPDAEDETIEFVRSMVKPLGLVEGRRLSKLDTERNNALLAGLDTELENPELADLLTVCEAVVRREAADIQALGKRLTAMLTLASRTGQLTPHEKTPMPPSSADSPEPSTSSPPSMDGPTPSSPTSAYDDSDKSSPPSANAAPPGDASANNG